MSKGQKECTNRGRDRVRFNSIQFHSKRMAFHLGYHSSPALLNYKKSYTHKNYSHTQKTMSMVDFFVFVPIHRLRPSSASSASSLDLSSDLNSYSATHRPQ